MGGVQPQASNALYSDQGHRAPAHRSQVTPIQISKLQTNIITIWTSCFYSNDRSRAIFEKYTVWMQWWKIGTVTHIQVMFPLQVTSKAKSCRQNLDTTRENNPVYVCAWYIYIWFISESYGPIVRKYELYEDKVHYINTLNSCILSLPQIFLSLSVSRQYCVFWVWWGRGEERTLWSHP